MAAVTRPQLEARARKLGVDLTAVDLDSITLPADAGDFPCSDEDDDEVLLLESDVGPPPELETGFANVIIIDNLPIVPVEKFERLESVVRAIYRQIGAIKEGGLWIPKLYTTYGYCFIEYATPQEAELARRKTHLYALDRSHRFQVNMFDDFDKYMEVPEEWTPAEIKPYTPGPNLHRWLMDEKARDQFVIRAGTSTKVYWNDVVPELAYQKQRWTDSFVQWSPLGTYLATVHRQGAQVWGGDGDFKRLMRFPHPHVLVQLIDFSPGERYLVTYSNHGLSNLRDTHRWVVLNIFDVWTGKVMRNSNGRCCYTCPKCLSRPVMRWSAGGDDHYFAMLGMGTIFVYETETFSLVDNTSLEIENVVDFSWSPTDSILCIFVQDPGSRIQLARVSLVQIPSKVELRWKHLFSVSDCKMYWQNNGEYLAIQVDRHAEADRRTCTTFELFRMKERGIPIEIFELDNKNDNIVAFAWEPRGSRFAVIHSDGFKHDISFYSMHSADDVSRVSKLTTLKDRQADALFWSPAGKFIVLAGLKGFNGQLEFYNVDDLETMATTEHPMATDVMWDPTGRFVATASVGHEMGNDIRIWSLIGKQIYKASKEQFSQFQWRRRPPSLLTPDKEKEISTQPTGKDELLVSGSN